jgi:hypothetical protein
MQAPELRLLDLRSPLVYRELAPAPVFPCPGFADGEEELLAFDGALLVREDPDDGPRVPALPPAAFRSGPGGAGAERGLPAGIYAFMQIKAESEAELICGLEAFARDAWWEALSLEGPYFVRRLGEDGKIAVQLLRRQLPPTGSKALPRD